MNITRAGRRSARIVAAALVVATSGGAALTATAVGSAAVAAPAASYASSGGATSWDPIANPSSNAAGASFASTCWTQGTQSSACMSQELAAINKQHDAEHIRSMKLPADFATLGADVQLLVVTNQERVDRGLPALAGLNKQLNTAARKGAKTNADPSFPGAPSGTAQWYGAASNWAMDYGVLGSDFDWMYNDGVGANNLDCTAGNHSGCWGHRQNILSVIPGSKNVLGAAQTGSTDGGHMQSVATIVVGLSGHPHLYAQHAGV